MSSNLQHVPPYRRRGSALVSDLLFKGIFSLIGYIDPSALATGIVLLLVGYVVRSRFHLSKLKAFFKKKEKKDYTISPVTPKQPNVIQLNSARAFELQETIDSHTRILQSTDLTEDQRSQIMNGWKSTRMEYDKLVYS